MGGKEEGTMGGERGPSRWHGVRGKGKSGGWEGKIKRRKERQNTIYETSDLGSIACRVENNFKRVHASRGLRDANSELLGPKGSGGGLY